MKNLVKAGLVLLSVTLLSACGNNPSTVSLEATDGSATFTSAGKNPSNLQGGKGQKGGFGPFAGIQLTAEQKTALDALRPTPEKKDPAAMKAQMEAGQKAIKEAFLADTINRDDLKAKLASFAPPAPDFAKQADTMIKSYNILTAEQKATLETKEAEMKAKIDAKVASGTIQKPTIDKVNPMFDKIGTDLGLTDAQKTSLKEAFAPPADATDMHTKMKANRDAINSAVKSGDVAKLTELLSANKPADHLEHHLDTIIKVHGILNAEQRAKIADKLPLFGFGGKGGHGRGGFGKGHGPEGFEGGMGKGGFDKHGKMGGQPPVIATTQAQ